MKFAFQGIQKLMVRWCQDENNGIFIMYSLSLGKLLLKGSQYTRQATTDNFWIKFKKLDYFWLQYLHQVQETCPCAEFWTWVLWILQMEDLSTGWVLDLIQEEASQWAAANQTTTSTIWVSFVGNSAQTRVVYLHLLKLGTEMRRKSRVFLIGFL